jgi:hypothetical protein
MKNLRQLGSWAIARAAAPAALRMLGPGQVLSALRKAKDQPILCERTWSCGASADLQWRQAITGDGRVVLADPQRPEGMLSAVLRPGRFRAEGDGLTASELRRRYADAAPMGVDLAAADRARLLDLAWEAREGFVAETAAAFTPERTTLSCFVPSEDGRTFERVLIAEEGATELRNLHPAAEALDEWLHALLPRPRPTLH